MRHPSIQAEKHFAEILVSQSRNQGFEQPFRCSDVGEKNNLFLPREQLIRSEDTIFDVGNG